MRQFKSISGLNDKILQLCIEDDIEITLKSESGVYVCFDGTAEILCEGSFPECYIYAKEFKKYKGFEIIIYSRECYDKMIADMRKAY